MKSSALIRSLLKSAHQTVRLAVDLAFPPCCTFCGLDLSPAAPQSGLCDACHESFCSLPGTPCPRCATPLPKTTQTTHFDKSACKSGDNGEISEVDASEEVNLAGQPATGRHRSQRPRGRCARCQNRHYYFEAAMALGVYQGALRVAVRRMKRPAFEQLTYTLGNLLSERVADWTIDNPVDLVVPVPMHWTRRLLRGANAAEALADAVARGLGVASDSRLVLCQRVTRKQGMLAPAERFANVQKAFRIARRGDVAGARILVVDDVMTTGATASEVARVLRRARAASVRVAVVGRGVGHG